MAAPMERPDLYVVARVLERLWNEDVPMLRTRLQVASKVNYDVFTKYLDWLLAKGLVELRAVEGGRDGIVLTEKGEEAYRKLVQWINDIIQGTGKI